MQANQVDIVIKWTFPFFMQDMIQSMMSPYFLLSLYLQVYHSNNEPIPTAYVNTYTTWSHSTC